jgi:hypothetical protein
MNLRVVDLCGPFCVDPVDGERLGAEAERILTQGDPLCLDFSEIKVLVSAFLSPALGCLYGKFPAKDLEERLRFLGLGPIEEDLVREVQAKARLFFESSPEKRRELLTLSDSFLEAG